MQRLRNTSVAYSAAKGSLSLDWCEMADVGLIKPDLVIYLDAPNRLNVSEEYELFQKSVQEQFKLLFAKYNDNVKIVDATRSIEDVSHEVLSLVKETIESVKDKPIGKLWKIDDHTIV